MGQNPAVGGHDAGFMRKGLAKPGLDGGPRRLRERDGRLLVRVARSAARRDGPAADQDRGLPPARGTAGEKEGSFTNTHRLIQWHDKAVEPPGDAARSRGSSIPWASGCASCTRRTRSPGRSGCGSFWTSPGIIPPRASTATRTWRTVLQEINGYQVADRSPVKDFSELKDDGSTAAGCWIYSGVMPEPGRNLARDRRPDRPGGPGTHLNWGFAWPANRRILYNRCSADPRAGPGRSAKKYIWWDAGEEASGSATTCPTSRRDKAPDYRPDWSKTPTGMDALRGDRSVHHERGRAGLAVRRLPACRTARCRRTTSRWSRRCGTRVYGQQRNPVAKIWERPENLYHAVGDPRVSRTSSPPTASRSTTPAAR